MLDVSVIAWVWMLSAMLVSSGAGLTLSRLVTWTDPARQAGIPRAFGLAIAPFLLGLMAIVALGVFRGASHAFHLGVVFAGLLALCAAAYFTRPVGRPVSRETSQPMSVWEWIFGGILTVWAVLLIVDALFMPLMQNDALEYATVGRLLFELRDLLAYPALDPAAGTSGFYGPWTHPPLYPALIYITSVFQGHADAPGLMRLISPWCALSATAVVYSMGCLANRLTGLLSALIFLSTPLLFLGAGSALIDPLPILGMTLILSVVMTAESLTVQRAIALGLTLGLSLWTHSQAVLFIPLAICAVLLQDGWRETRAVCGRIGIMLGIAVLISAWPYSRNLSLFGSFISDTPAVFAVPELGWAEYFSKVRGIASWPGIIQYGLFKGWFALEAYSWSFWLMLLGVILCVKRVDLRRSWRDFQEGNSDGITNRRNGVMLGVFLFYLCGVMLSAGMGIDLMIRNERYLLVLMPCVSLFAGSGIAKVLSGLRRHVSAEDALGDLVRRGVRFLFILVVLSVFAAQLYVVGGHRWRTLGLTPRQIWLTHEEKLSSWPAFKAVNYLKTSAARGATVLSMKPADMYYADRHMISYLDPRLLPFYRERNAEAAAQILRDLGVRYIHIPDYSLPTVYDSSLETILSRSDFTRLVFSAGGNQIYELGGTAEARHGSVVDMSPGKIPWRQSSQLNLGGRKGLLRISLSSRALEPGEHSFPRFSTPFFQRDLTTLLLSEPREIRETAGAKHGSLQTGSSEYRVDLDMEGNAFAHIYVRTVGADGQLQEEYLIGETALEPHDSVRRFTRRFTVNPNTASVGIVVEHRGKTEIRIRSATIRLLSEVDVQTSASRPETPSRLKRSSGNRP